MSKVEKGVKALVTQGPVEVLRKLKNKTLENRKKRDFRKKVRSFHMISKEQRIYQREKTFEHSITFSIITPLYNTPKKYLIDLIQSLEKQTYSNWELCLADGSDCEHTYVGKICRKWSKRDSRIVYSPLVENKGISHNTNACLRLSSGQYLGLLDHDDILHESALFEMMMEISKNDADFLYSDEVKFSGKIKNAMDFNFKPGFGKDELRSHNYICHFTVFSRNLLEKIGQVYRPEFDGSQDHDMVLRLTEKASKIVHVPKVLYYWRVHPESVSMNLDSKSYAVDAAIRAVQEQIEREEEPGKVTSNLPYRTIYRIKYDIDNESSITIIVHNLKSIEEYEEFKTKIKKITNYPKIDFLPAINQGRYCLGKKLNEVIRQCEAEYLVIMDSQSTPVNADWVEELLMFAQRRDVAAVSPRVLYPDESIAYAGIALDNRKRDKIRFLCQGIPNSEQGYEAILRYVRNTTAVWKGCFMVKRDKLLSLGGFNEDLNGYEDVDFSLRAVHSGYYNVWTCFAEIKYSGNHINDFSNGNTKAFANKWDEVLKKEDPYYHKNWRKLKLV